MSTTIPHLLGLFEQAKLAVEADLLETGFAVSLSPARQPSLPEKLSALSKVQLKDLLDEYHAWHEYLTNQLVVARLYLDTEKEKLAHVKALVLIRIASTKEKHSADLREALVMTDDEVLDVYQEFCYRRNIADGHDERRKSMARSMERIYRELVFRVEVTPQELAHSRGILPRLRREDGVHT